LSREASICNTCIMLEPETYHVMESEDLSPSELSESSHNRQPLTSLCLCSFRSAPAGSALSSAALCRGAAPGHSCLFSVLPTCHELPPSQESIPAQQQKTSPRQHYLYLLWAPLRFPLVSRTTGCETG